VRPIGFDEIAGDVLAAAGDGPFTLVGYSQGGRIGLHLALAAPERVQRLVLVSTTAGLEDAAAREARIASDEQLARRMEGQGIDAAARAVGGAGAVRRADAGGRRARPRGPPAQRPQGPRRRPPGRRHRPHDAALGPAARAHDALGRHRRERDRKFVDIGRRLADSLPDATFTLVPDAGHALPWEKPAAIADVISGARDSSGA
jgi:2-succinyl-6-hydroxy-2,4-cyclohexadiene-1-carboxylate synthase